MKTETFPRTHDEIAFTKNNAPYGWLGNMSRHPIHAEGTVWPTAEALFQALRFNHADHARIREEIRAAKSPMTAKMLAKKHRCLMTTSPQSEADVENMGRVLKWKVEQHPDLLDQLRQTGRRPIIEDCSRRMRGNALFWGASWSGQERVGQNKLGVLWMRLRDEFAT